MWRDVVVGWSVAVTLVAVLAGISLASSHRSGGAAPATYATSPSISPDAPATAKLATPAHRG